MDRKRRASRNRVTRKTYHKLREINRPTDRDRDRDRETNRSCVVCVCVCVYLSCTILKRKKYASVVSIAVGLNCWTSGRSWNPLCSLTGDLSIDIWKRL